MNTATNNYLLHSDILDLWHPDQRMKSHFPTLNSVILNSVIVGVNLLESVTHNYTKLTIL